MASATTLLPAKAIGDLAINDEHHTSSALTGSAANDSTEMSVEYWTNLLRQNLSKAKSIATADSDTEDSASLQVNEEVMNAPRRKTVRDALAREIAARLYPAPPDSLAPVIKYEKDIAMLRSLVLDQRRSAKEKATERNAKTNWIKRIAKQGPWDEEMDALELKGAPSLPMPVEQSDKESLASFFAHLASDGTHDPASASSSVGRPDGFTAGTEPYYTTELIEFEKGVLYADGRVDLCKMATGPRNIADLMHSLKTNTLSRHFLLGNNVVGPVGARAIAQFIEELPDRMETWYLAGNCIDADGFRALVDSMVMSPAITNVWMKRNPLGPTAGRDVFRLITQTPNLRTVDLDQTELGDDGVAELFELLAEHKQPLPLRNLYVNACGIGVKACTQVARYLSSPHCQLESLYASLNPIGHGLEMLATGLKSNKTIRRLSLQSCGLKDAGVVALAEALQCNQTLAALDIGQGYATEDLGMRFNWIGDDSAHALADLVKESKLQYLVLSYVPLSQASLNTILEAIASSESLVWFHAKPLTTGQRETAAVKAGQEGARMHKLVRERLHGNVERQYGVDYVHFENEHKRFLISPVDVRLIDSVYRNRDAGAARRGLKRLEKWWGEGDETLQKVQDGDMG